MDLMNLMNAFGSQIASGIAQPDLKAMSTCTQVYGFGCDYDCSGMFECSAYGCGIFQCGTAPNGFSCNNLAGGDDFTCGSAYTQAPGCASPVPSIPCPGF